MATIDDFGDTAEPLNNPVLGGPAGWAAAVRDYLKNLDSRIVSGRLTVVLDSSGSAVIAHGMGQAPRVAFAEYDYTTGAQTPGLLNDNPYILITSWDATNIIIQAVKGVDAWSPFPQNTYIGVKWVCYL